MTMEKICYSCMTAFDGDDICPNCGEKAEFVQDRPMLPLNYYINEKYLIGRCIDSRGDGFTYIGMDVKQNHKVYIREFFPIPLAKRAEDYSTVVQSAFSDEYDEYMADFQDMAKKLIKLNDQGSIMPVYDILWANNTIYYITEYVENVMLTEAVGTAMGKGILWAAVKNLFDEFLTGLSAMHRLGIVHRGISPDTVRLCTDGRLRLSGFSIPAARMEGRGIRPVLAEGFAAPEQFIGSPYPDSSSDIYSVCATIYFTLTGTPYREGQIEESIYPPDLPNYVIKVLKKGLRPDPEQRFVNADELKAALNDERIANGGFSVPADLTDKLEGYELGDETVVTESKKKKSNLKVVMITTLFGVLILAIVVVLALYVFLDVNIFTDGWYKASAASTSESSGVSEESTVSTAVAFVPDLGGLHINDITERVDPERFTVQIKMSGFNDDYPRNYIMAQSPAAGAPSPGITTLVLTVSRGPEYIVMPELVGKTVEQVIKDLNEMGMKSVLMVMPGITETDTNNDGIMDDVQVMVDADGDGIAETAKKLTRGVILQSSCKKGDILHGESTIGLYAVPALPVTSVAASSVTESAATGSGAVSAASSQSVVSWVTNPNEYPSVVAAMTSSGQTSSY